MIWYFTQIWAINRACVVCACLCSLFCIVRRWLKMVIICKASEFIGRDTYWASITSRVCVYMCEIWCCNNLMCLLFSSGDFLCIKNLEITIFYSLLIGLLFMLVFLEWWFRFFSVPKKAVTYGEHNLKSIGTIWLQNDFFYRFVKKKSVTKPIIGSFSISMYYKWIRVDDTIQNKVRTRIEEIAAAQFFVK